MPGQPSERRTAFLTAHAAVAIAYALSRADDDDDDADRARLARDLDIVLARVDFDTDYAGSVTVGIILTNAERDLIRGAMLKHLPISPLISHIEDALAKASR